MIICNSDWMNSSISFWLLAAEYPTLVQSIKHVMCRAAGCWAQCCLPGDPPPHHRCCHGNVGAALTHWAFGTVPEHIGCLKYASLWIVWALRSTLQHGTLGSSLAHLKEALLSTVAVNAWAQARNANIYVLGHASWTYVRATAGNQ